MVYLHLLQDFGVIPKGSVERFHPRIAERLLKEGIAELEANMIKGMTGPPAHKQIKSAPRRK